MTVANDDPLIVLGPNDDEAAGGPGGARRVTVAEPFQVCHGGDVYRPGDTAIVPEALAQEWIKARWVNAAE